MRYLVSIEEIPTGKIFIGIDARSSPILPDRTFIAYNARLPA